MRQFWEFAPSAVFFVALTAEIVLAIARGWQDFSLFWFFIGLVICGFTAMVKLGIDHCRSAK